jgi:beta-xylosidase
MKGKIIMKNPIINGHYADPDIAFFEDKYYIYPTTDGGKDWEGPYFKVFSSSDLKDWTDEGVILNISDIKWCGGIRGWAPAIAEKNGKYYFYYSANKNIGVAISDMPVSGFKDIGRPLVASDEYEGQTIDPDAFVDDDGTPYIYWGNAYLYGARLKDNMIELDGKAIELTPKNYGEGPCIFKRKGIYYFTWSCEDTCSPEYHVRYGKSVSPLEIPKGNDVILSRHYAEDSRIKGTGHHSIINVPNTDDWYIVYHRFDAERFGELDGFNREAGNNREICMDKLEFDDEGNILPVYATL